MGLKKEQLLWTVYLSKAVKQSVGSKKRDNDICLQQLALFLSYYVWLCDNDIILHSHSSLQRAFLTQKLNKNVRSFKLKGRWGTVSSAAACSHISSGMGLPLRRLGFWLLLITKRQSRKKARHLEVYSCYTVEQVFFSSAGTTINLALWWPVRPSLSQLCLTLFICSSEADHFWLLTSHPEKKAGGGVGFPEKVKTQMTNSEESHSGNHALDCYSWRDTPSNIFFQS